MRKTALSLTLLALLALAAAPAPAGAQETLTFGRFGKVTIYLPDGVVQHLVLFISGDGGWNLGVVGMAKSLTDYHAAVAGIDIRAYTKAAAAASDSCTDAAADFEALARHIEKELGFHSETKPVIVGYSSGATLAYAVLVQAKPHRFRGAISLGFCPDLLLHKPLCAGHDLSWKQGTRAQGVLFDPSDRLEDPFVALQGDIDKVCAPEKTAEYMKKVSHGELVMLPKVGHGYSVERRWMPQFRDAFQRLVETP
jgi:type IV secretory pathway VirJ component